MEDDDPHQPRAPWPPWAKVKVARSRDQSEPSWPNAVPVSLAAGGGISCRPNPAATLLKNADTAPSTRTGGHLTSFTSYSGEVIRWECLVLVSKTVKSDTVDGYWGSNDVIKESGITTWVVWHCVTWVVLVLHLLSNIRCFVILDTMMILIFIACSNMRVISFEKMLLRTLTLWIPRDNLFIPSIVVETI